MSAMSMRNGTTPQTEESIGVRIVQKAIELIERPNGWCKGAWWKTIKGSFWKGDREYAYSIDGALLESSPDFRSLGEAYRVLKKTSGWVNDFNDRPETTQQQAIAFLRERIV